ncbi:Chloramphenicol acetyltransferase-like domain [Lecanosticta acicola]|uniref:Chloramphenicol acetyltransferase-like domain n=1 Tax=Lecanosticta acicola TaxID=111012 RepID=A0AAI8YW83_9PEZI|nr:Chloramphenicol acetyltransferase-like domain [Lecanosticta acicola]
MAAVASIEPSGSESNAPEAQIHWVSPLEPIEAQTIALPAPDQVGITVIQPLMVCFKTTEHYREDQFIESVKKAASGCIWEIPALAGSVVWEDESRHRTKVDIPHDAKVQVKINYLPQKNAEELDRQHWPPRTFPHAEVCLSPRPTYGIGSYNFGVQANIIQGGVILVLHMNHTILDGSAQAIVEEIFAHHLSRAMDGEAPIASGLVPPEALDKSRAYGTHPAKPILEWKDWRLATENTMSEEAQTAALLDRMAKLTLTVWYISPARLAKLRAAMQDPSQPKMSLATCLTIWLWAATSRARGHSPDTETRMLMPVQTRVRVPDMHENHSGSALVYGRTKATLGELNTLRPHAIGERIANSIAFWTPERIREYWGSIEDCDDVAKYHSNTNREFGTDLEFTHMSNFKFYGIPWGRGLQVRAYRLPGIAFTDGWTVFLPKQVDDGRELMIYLSRDTLGRLMKDASFREYAEYWSSLDPSIDRQAAETATAWTRPGL